MGLRDITFDYDVTQARAAEGAHTALAEYELMISQVPGARNPGKKDLKVHSFQSAALVDAQDKIIEALAAVVAQAGGK